MKLVLGATCAVICLAFVGRARAAEPPKDKDVSETEPEHKRVRVGATGGVAFPRPLSIEAMTKIDDTFAIGLDYSLLPKVSVFGADASMWAVGADFRAFIKKSGFFVGMMAGYQHLSVGTTTVLTGPVSISGDTPFVNPRIGYLGTWSSGFTVGIDAGVQLPLNGTFSSNLPTQYAPAQQITDVAHAFGKGVMPTFDLLRLGFLI